MDANANIFALVQYGLDMKLIELCDKTFIIWAPRIPAVRGIRR